MKKVRLDRLLVERGAFADEAEALRAVLAREVKVDGAYAASAAMLVAPDADVQVKGRPAYVSRGGLKLRGALDAFGFDPAGLRCIDVGCSTGGFTDCLLQAGAASVACVDVGYGDLAWKLRQDERVTVFERTNIRTADPVALGAPFDLIVADVSFIGLASLAPVFAALAHSGHPPCQVQSAQGAAPAAQIQRPALAAQGASIAQGAPAAQGAPVAQGQGAVPAARGQGPASVAQLHAARAQGTQVQAARIQDPVPAAQIQRPALVAQGASIAQGAPVAQGAPAAQGQGTALAVPSSGGTTFIGLVKPQFESRAGETDSRGFVRDESVRIRTIDEVRAALEQAGFTCEGVVESPITGKRSGNVEYLLKAVYRYR